MAFPHLPRANGTVVDEEGTRQKSSGTSSSPAQGSGTQHPPRALQPHTRGLAQHPHHGATAVPPWPTALAVPPGAHL